jgi:signal transduction histidine kinase
MSIRLKLITAFLVLIVVFIAVYLVNKRLTDVVLRNSEYFNRSEAIIRNSNQLQKYIIDMQSGFRGFLLTSQPSFLTSYTEGRTQLPRLMMEQHMLVSEERQRRRLDSVVDMQARWMEYADEVIASRLDTNETSRVKYRFLLENRVKAEVGKKLNDEIRRVFDAFDADEYAIRSQRREVLQSSIETTNRVNLFVAALSILLALVSSVFFSESIIRRIRVMVGLAQDISLGRFRRIKDSGRDELHALSESLNTMSETLEKNFHELRKKNIELDEFAYVVSHDLKAPLRGIDNITRWITEDHFPQLSPELKNYVDLIRGRTKRLENLINGLLDYARIGRTRHAQETVDVDALLRETADLLVPVGFTFRIDGKMPVIHTERILLQQVFSNLISNAVKYNDKAHGVITVRCRLAGDRYEFEVEDNGPGIEPEYHEKIFRIFQTLKERDAFESTGVGLAIVKRIIEEQKMTITVNSVPKKGVTFKFTWPREKEAEHTVD